MENILERLKSNQHQDSTKANYVSIWRSFNAFLVHLDRRPKAWEDRTSLYCAYLVERGVKSTTIRSYISAIKHILITDKYEWDDNRIMVNVISRACKLSNDRVTIRFPIHIGLLETMLFEMERLYSKQPYLLIMFKALFLVAYYGLMRIGEITQSRHVLKACNVFLGTNKKKFLLILNSSKMHTMADEPQLIKISQLDENSKFKRNFCPFTALEVYRKMRGEYLDENEQFFIFSDRSPVKPEMVRNLLKRLLKRLNLNSDLYNCQSFHIGRATDMAKYGIAIDIIKHLGRWKSNAVYNYLKHWN